MSCITVPSVTIEEWQLRSVTHLTANAPLPSVPSLVIQLPLHATCLQTWALQVRIFLVYAHTLSHCSRAKPHAGMHRSSGASGLTKCCAWMSFFVNARCWHCSRRSGRVSVFLLGEFPLGVFEVLSFQWTLQGTITSHQKGSSYINYKRGETAMSSPFFHWGTVLLPLVCRWRSALHSKG